MTAWRQPFADRGRRFGRRRWRQWRTHGWQITQCAVAAAAAWWVASALLGHERPFFAPVVAVVALGVSYAARLRRVGEVVAGVALGVAVGDVFVRVAGTGTWQIALVIAVAMSLAVLLEVGPILVTQAGVQASIVTTLIPPTSEGLNRWLDAVVGGAVALVAAAVVPTSPLRRPRRLTAGLLDDLAEVLLTAANSIRDRDAGRAEQALQHARSTQRSLDELSDAAQEGLDVLQVSPFRRRYRTGMRDIGSIAEPLDRAARGVRAVLRQVVAVVRNCEPVPAALLDLVERLSSACALLAADLAAERPLNDAVDTLHAVARASATVPRSSLPGDVIFGQVRSTVVDLFQVAGLDLDESLARMPPPRGQHSLGDTPPDGADTVGEPAADRELRPAGLEHRRIATVPVISGDTERMEDNVFKTVVWASDGSAAAERALPFAKGIAQSSGARLIVIYVNEIRVDSRAALATTIANIEDEELAAVRRKAEALQQDGIAAEFVTGDVTVGGVARVIADLARDADADLIVTGTRGKNPLVGLLVGSVTSRLLEVAPCPVLAVPSTQPQSADS